jgi:hypothetical protein
MFFEYCLIVTGDAEFNDYPLLKKKCDNYIRNNVKNGENVVVMSAGSEEGADNLGEKYAKERGFTVRRFIPNWDKFGKSARFIRNRYMIKNSDGFIAFTSPYCSNSSLTNSFINDARSNRLNVKVVREEED